MNPSSSSLPRLWLRLLTFRATAEDYENLDHRHLIAGLIVCWIVGAGRYWDDPRATLLQHTGVGSVVYVFVLAAVLWIIAKPTAPERFSYAGILTFITLTAPPAALYAIPVEKWMTLEEANAWNLNFLGIVALWRVVLWGHYVRRHGWLGGGQVFAVVTMPLAIIFLTLVSMNLHHVVLDVMGGIRNADKSSQDSAFQTLMVFSFLSVPVSFAGGLVWILAVIQAWGDWRRARQTAPAVTAPSTSAPPSASRGK